MYTRETAVSVRLGKQWQGAEGVCISLRQLAAFSNRCILCWLQLVIAVSRALKAREGEGEKGRIGRDGGERDKG